MEGDIGGVVHSINLLKSSCIQSFPECLISFFFIAQVDVMTFALPGTSLLSTGFQTYIFTYSHASRPQPFFPFWPVRNIVHCLFVLYYVLKAYAQSGLNTWLLHCQAPVYFQQVSKPTSLPYPDASSPQPFYILACQKYFSLPVCTSLQGYYLCVEFLRPIQPQRTPLLLHRNHHHHQHTLIQKLMIVSLWDCHCYFCSS